MAENGYTRGIVVGVVVAAIIAGGGLLWNWGSSGGLVRILGGPTPPGLHAMT
jgi:hypothetical protein